MRDGFDAENRKVLKVEGVTTDPDPSYDMPLWDVNFTLSRGELMLIRLEEARVRLPVADIATGILEPQEGSAEFLGMHWQKMSPDDAATHRGKIGRVFEGNGWIGNLDIDENITLAQRHHTKRPEQDIEEEAAHLSRYFSLPGLPKGPVSRTRQEDLTLASCVRAFLGNPVLLILERPTRYFFPGIMPALMNAIRSARDRGAAVLWTTSEPLIWDDTSICPTLKGTMFGSRMNVVPVEA
jgi:phospholipid/cholesterol/gamma-HCH transport system ATP-binding protein